MIGTGGALTGSREGGHEQRELVRKDERLGHDVELLREASARGHEPAGLIVSDTDKRRQAPHVYMLVRVQLSSLGPTKQALDDFA